jgi:hypothetical protein
LLALNKPFTAVSIKRTYGCPGGAFAKEAEAVKWLEELLAQATSGARI